MQPLECTPGNGQAGNREFAYAGWALEGRPCPPTEFSPPPSSVRLPKEYLAGASLNALGRKHEVARNLIRIWVAKYQAGEYEPDFIPMPRLSAHEVKIAELERMVGKLTMELEFLRGVLRSTPLQRGAITSIVTGPVASPSSEDANS